MAAICRYQMGEAATAGTVWNDSVVDRWSAAKNGSRQQAQAVQRVMNVGAVCMNAKKTARPPLPYTQPRFSRCRMASHGLVIF